MEISPSSRYYTEREPALVADAGERRANGASPLESLPYSELKTFEEE